MYGVSVQVGTLSGDYELKLTLEDGTTTLAVLIVCPDNSAAPSTAPSESPKRLLQRAEQTCVDVDLFLRTDSYPGETTVKLSKVPIPLQALLVVCSFVTTYHVAILPPVMWIGALVVTIWLRPPPDDNY